MQDEFDDYDEYEQGSFSWMLVVVLLLAVAGFFSLAWYAYETGSQPMDSGEVVVIKADSTPVKETPIDPGGMEFPHQEKTIYQVVESDGERNEMEVTLIPQEEEPDWEAIERIQEEAKQARLNKPEAADKKIAEIIRQAVKEANDRPAAVEKEAPKEKVVKITDEAPSSSLPITRDPFTSSQKVVRVQPDMQPRESNEVANGFKIQLGAFRDRVEAEKQWQKISRANSDVLGDRSHQVIRADLGAKGIFYRLRVVGFEDKDAAQNTCKTLSQRRQGCFPVQ